VSLHVTRSVFAVTVVTIAPFLFSAGAMAKPAKKKGPQIVAHLDRQGVQATQLTLRSKDDRTYLYMYEPSGDVLVTVDVTRPENPVVVSLVRNAGHLETNRIGSIAMVRSSDRAQAAASAEQKTSFLDVSDPANPQPIPELDGATGMATDTMRGYLFVANKTGLWVIHDDNLVDPGVKAWYDFANAR
jgi:hypothetical protein